MLIMRILAKDENARNSSRPGLILSGKWPGRERKNDVMNSAVYLTGREKRFQRQVITYLKERRQDEIGFCVATAVCFCGV